MGALMQPPRLKARANSAIAVAKDFMPCRARVKAAAGGISSGRRAPYSKCYTGLQQTDRIADDQPVLIELVVAVVPAHARIAPAHVEVFQRAALHRIAYFGLAAPLLAVGDGAGVYVAAADIAVHQGQARYAEGGEFVSSDPFDRSLSPVSNRPKLTFRESSPDQWEVVESLLVSPAKRAIGAIRSECNEQLGRVDQQINRVKVYAKNSKFPLELEEILERDAQKLEGLVNELERDFASELHVEKPKPGTPQSLRNRLREGAKKLREQAIWVLKSLPPTEAVVEFLLTKNEVRLVKEGVRIKMFGPRNDYVQEYQVLNTNNQVLWYAHLHYSQLNTAVNAPNAAHFKLRLQRKVSKQSLDAKAKPGEKVPDVHYGKISKKMLTDRFVPLEH